METYCIYLRKSRADVEAEKLGELETLSRHLNVLTRLAERNHHPITHIYREIVSGDTIDARPEMQQLLDDVNDGKWTGVYVMEVERLARGNTMDQGLVANAFRDSNTFIYTPVKTYNPADPSDEDFFEFSLFMSRREYKTIKRRLQSGIQQSVREGKIVGGHCPYGYRLKKLTDQKGYTLEIYEPEAAVVRQIFDWYLNGIDGAPAGIFVIANKLTQLGIHPGPTATTWDANRVNRLLSRQTYVGKVIYGERSRKKVRRPDGSILNKVTVRDPGSYIVADGLHPAIIDQDTFDRVQAKLHGPDQAWHPVRRDYGVRNPYLGLLYCSQCGHLMGRQPADPKRPVQIMCRQHGCPTVRSFLPAVDSAVLTALRSWLIDSPSFISTPPASTEPDPDALARQSLAALRSDIDALRRQLTRAQELVELSVYTISEYNARRATLVAQITEKELTATKIESDLASRPVYATLPELQPALLRLFDEYDTATPADQNALLRAVVSKIVYTKSVNRGPITLDIYPRLK